ncbi:MAG: serine/threonine-protein phosphatase [Actinobacteria bacterium]|nr:serine/threonine-protein phosphatase [Actinomycetota bacterium]
MEYYALTNIGKYREKNEDSFYAVDGLFIVADGMGGHLAGEVASSLSIEAFVKRLAEKIRSEGKNLSSACKTETGTVKVLTNISTAVPVPGNILSNIHEIPESSVKSTLISSLKAANKEVFNMSASSTEYYGMGTTFTCCLVSGDLAHIIHAGDSRLYHKDKSGLKLVTEDHTITGELYRRGEISYQETFNHPQRNFLTNVLGISEKIKPDYHTINLNPGDILVLCSDGLNSMVRDSQIENIIEKTDKNRETNKEKVKVIAEKLVKEALKNGGRDNITVIAIKS